MMLMVLSDVRNASLFLTTLTVTVLAGEETLQACWPSSRTVEPVNLTCGLIPLYQGVTVSHMIDWPCVDIVSRLYPTSLLKT